MIRKTISRAVLSSDPCQVYFSLYETHLDGRGVKGAPETLSYPWRDLHSSGLTPLFAYAEWTYLTIPFCLTWAGFAVAEIEPWQEQDETWRRLRVKFPPHIASHSIEQAFYLVKDGLLRRHDYEVEIIGNMPAPHYISDYQYVSGIFEAFCSGIDRMRVE